MRGYKVFNEDWTCRGLKYKVGEKYKIDKKPECCKVGFHFCEKLKDCFKYYAFDPKNKVAIVEALGDIDREKNGSKACTNKIKIIEELTWNKVLDLVNTGDYNTGDYNTGHWNTGDWNTGNRNIGCFNTKTPKMHMFNRETNITYEDWEWSRVKSILEKMPTDNLIWVCDFEMTDKEKENNPTYKTTGGYLKTIRVTDKEKQEWYNSLKEEDKKEIQNMPNFDAEIFKEITGIEAISISEYKGEKEWRQLLT